MPILNLFSSIQPMIKRLRMGVSLSTPGTSTQMLSFYFDWLAGLQPDESGTVRVQRAPGKDQIS